MSEGENSTTRLLEQTLTASVEIIKALRKKLKKRQQLLHVFFF